MSEKIAILGSSRGLGAALSAEISDKEKDAKLFLVSRTSTNFQSEAAVYYNCDLTKQDQIKNLYNFLSLNDITRFVYVAGGGPWGKYSLKDWKDHMWTLQLNLLTPAFLLHSILRNQDYHWRSLSQIVFVGSGIAESEPDPSAASYAGAKHALKGLILTVKAEYPDMDIRLFSPGYMDTMMLPPNAWPRKQTNLVKSPKEVAEKMWSWMCQPPSEDCHFKL